jgi:hypothetical protein
MSGTHYPIDSYYVRGEGMTSNGGYIGFRVDLSFERMTETDLMALEDFLKAKGWLK